MHISDLIEQRAIIRELKKLEIIPSFGWPCSNKKNSIFTPVFTDAERLSDNAQFSAIFWLLIGSLDCESYYHVVAQTSHKLKCPEQYIAAKDLQEIGEGIDEGLMLKKNVLNVARS